MPLGTPTRKLKKSSKTSLIIIAGSVSILLVWIFFLTSHLSAETHPDVPDAPRVSADVIAKLKPDDVAPAPPVVITEKAGGLAPVAQPVEHPKPESPPAYVDTRDAGLAFPAAKYPETLATTSPKTEKSIAPTVLPSKLISSTVEAVASLKTAAVIEGRGASAKKTQETLPTGPADVVAQMQRAAYLFFQAVGYQMYLNNIQAYRLQWLDFRKLIVSYAAVHRIAARGTECDNFQRLFAEVQGFTLPPPGWWVAEFPAKSIRAFACGFPTEEHTAKVPPDMARANMPALQPELLWLTEGIPLATTGALSEVVPFLSSFVGTNFTDSRIIRSPSMFALTTRLWLAVFNALKAAVGHAPEAEQAVAFDHFAELMAPVVQMFPCGNCQNQFVAIFQRFAVAKNQFFGLAYMSLFRPMMGTEDLAQFEPDCHVEWNNRPLHPAPSITAEMDPKLFLLPVPEVILKRRLTVALDIDETLLYARVKPPILRPFLMEFLDGLRALGCEIVIWTASSKDWGTYVVTLFDPKQLIPHRIYRDKSWWAPRPSVYTKDLRRLGRSMNDTLILENSPYSVWMNKRNAILIPDYYKFNPRDGILSEVLNAARQILETGQTVPDFISTSRFFNHKCGAQMWDGLDEAQPYYGIGDFTS